MLLHLAMECCRSLLRMLVMDSAGRGTRIPSCGIHRSLLNHPIPPTHSLAVPFLRKGPLLCNCEVCIYSVSQSSRFCRVETYLTTHEPCASPQTRYDYRQLFSGSLRRVFCGGSVCVVFVWYFPRDQVYSTYAWLPS